ncbi:uncharacterized protein LOC130585113 [Malurus melanocephalus]|uniref:uncharacterized protein LOC130585113 n=1 Tax=Malurus melanocephalus TaxID=175006 RepID=UPI002547479D|nr:uncharacterized protein LOC130585113 [Malurus melanocephalus]
MGELRARSVLVTGANRGIGLGFVQHFLKMPNPPQWIFATCRDPKGQRAQPLLKKAAQGSPGSGLSCSKAAIANISSIGGSITFPFGWEMVHATSYRCSKAALNMLTKCQSLGYREPGILCIALHPGWVQTDLGAAAGQTPPLTVDESVQGMLKVLSSISEKDTGTFLDWEGKVIPW